MTSRLSSLRRFGKPERALQLGSALAVAAIVSIVAFLLDRERISAEQSASRAATNLVQLIEAEVQRNAELYDLALLGLIETTRDPGFAGLPGGLQQRLLFDRAVITSLRGDLLWVDRQGDIVADSLQVPPRQINFGQWPTFQAHRQQDEGLRISRPFHDSIGDLGWCISFSRRISGDQGEFLGVASGAMRLSYFSDLFKTLDIGAEGSVSLISDDGIMLARHPESSGATQIGANLSHYPNFQRILREGNGSFADVSGISHRERLYTFSRVSHLPLIVVVALSTDEVFASWQRTAMLVSIATGLLCSGIIWLSLLLGRELRLRRRAERHLAQLAATDGLTGLANRRALDALLHAEWARALRSGQPITVLMIDVDHFKAFNECHGHQGGDHALRIVAKTIEQSIRRPSDQAGRYGGEEFVVILADTDLQGGLMIAEAIRSAVAALPPTVAGAKGLTVSIGVCSQLPDGNSTVEALLGCADASLYSAKQNGRNQVVAG